MTNKKTGEALRDSFVSALGTNKVSFSRVDRLACARDQWPRSLMQLRQGRPAPEPPMGVVWPESTEDVVSVLGWAVENGVGLVPYGGGTGLSGGAMPRRGDVVVDMKRMSAVEWVRAEDNLVRAQCGVLGIHLEERLRKEGLTLGHFPSSLTSSTLGGWLAVGSAGQASARYGKIEDMVVSLEVVLPSGLCVETNPSPGSGVGPQWARFFVGSEGILGVITKATLKIRRSPEQKYWRGYAFPRVSAGCEAMRRVAQCGLRPAVFRLYDELGSLVLRSFPEEGSPDALMDVESAAHIHVAGEESGRGAKRAGKEKMTKKIRSWLDRKTLKLATKRPVFFNRLSQKVVEKIASRGCLLVVGVEGNGILAEAEMVRCHRELERAGGVDLGETPGRDWARNRYSVPFKQSEVFSEGSFLETVEVAATWDKVLEIYQAARRSIAPHAFMTAHFGHIYPDGCAISFTVMGSEEGERIPFGKYDELMRDLLSAVTRHGGTISHHHGIGRSRKGFLLEELGDAYGLMRQIKKKLDPQNIMNPGKLLVEQGSTAIMDNRESAGSVEGCVSP